LTLMFLVLFSLFLVFQSEVHKIPTPGRCLNFSYDTFAIWGDSNCTSRNFCADGDYQSPINIESTYHDHSLPRLEFANYGPTQIQLKVVNKLLRGYFTNGYYTNDNHAGVFYQASEFNIHSAAEIQISGVQPSLSISIHHYLYPPPSNKTVAISIVMLLFQVGTVFTPNNTLFDSIIDAITTEEGELKNLVDGEEWTIPFEGFFETFNTLRNENRDGYYNFVGSLTQPPCSERVDYTVMETILPISIAQYQILKLADINVTSSLKYPPLSNSRPIQRDVRHVKRRPSSSHANILVFNLYFFSFVVALFLILC